jgi:RNA polymerase sigma-70 factor (ECF subfamily)
MSEEIQNLKVFEAIQGDEKSFSWLVNQWYHRIYNFGNKYFNDHDMAMEITQKTFVTMHQKIKDLKKIEAFTGWLYTIAVNKCREEDRKMKRKKWISIFSSEQGNNHPKPAYMVKSYDNPENNFQKKELSEMLSLALSKIPSEQKTVLIMKEFEGLKFREIAEVLQLSENTVKSRVYYGLKALKNIMQKWNIKIEEVYYES